MTTGFGFVHHLNFESVLSLHVFTLSQKDIDSDRGKNDNTFLN